MTDKINETEKPVPDLEIMLTEDQEIAQAYNRQFEASFKAQKRVILNVKIREAEIKAQTDARKKANSKGVIVDFINALRDLIP